MKIRILRSARTTGADGIRFYERQEVGLGSYFLNSILSDIRSLSIYTGIHQKYDNFYFRMVCTRFPKFEDFNNDGLNDLTFISGTAARGANEIRTLLIYEKKSDELLHIKNSADYPNLAYNSRLDCIDAWSFYGGTATVFLRLKGDMLEEFASVEDFPPNRTVTVRDRNGREKVIRRDKIADNAHFI